MTRFNSVSSSRPADLTGRTFSPMRLCSRASGLSSSPPWKKCVEHSEWLFQGHWRPALRHCWWWPQSKSRGWQVDARTRRSSSRDRDSASVSIVPRPLTRPDVLPTESPKYFRSIRKTIKDDHGIDQWRAGTKIRKTFLLGPTLPVIIEPKRVCIFKNLQSQPVPLKFFLCSLWP